MKTTRKLRVADDAYAAHRRVYVVGLDADEFANDVKALEKGGRIVINGDEDRLIDEIDLRVHLAGLTVADDLMIPSTWWTSTVAHQLVTVAGWLRLGFIDPSGASIETTSAGAR